MKSETYGKLGSRILFSIVASAIIIIVSVVICVLGVRFALDENITGQRALDRIDGAASGLYGSLIDQETGQRGYILTNDTTFLEPYYQGTEDYTSNAELLKKQIEIYPDLADEIHELIEKGQYWHVHFAEPMIELFNNGEQLSLAFLQEGKVALDEFRELADSFFVKVEAERSVVRDKMQFKVNATLISLAAFVTVIILINIYISLRAIRSVTKPIIELSNCVTAYTDHDFSKRIPEYKQSDELAQLIENVDIMRHELSTSIDTLQSAVNTDGLTGLFNRRFFNEFLKKEWQEAKTAEKPLSLILFDIDYFKKYNDTYGHVKGDDCLKSISKKIHAYCQGTLNFTARYGGEEFAILLINRSKQETVAIAEEIKQAVEDLKIPHKTSPVSNYVTISVGVSTIIPTANETASQLIETADQALYKSKQNGRNQVTLL